MERFIGTWLGLGLAAEIILTHPQGLWLVAGIIEASEAAVVALTPNTPATPGIRAARLGFQRRTLRLSQTFDNAINGSASQREAAETAWPTVAATQRLAYRALAECLRHERSPHPEDVAAQPPTQTAELQRLLQAMAAAVRAGGSPQTIGTVPTPLSPEVQNLYDVLVRRPI